MVKYVKRYVKDGPFRVSAIVERIDLLKPRCYRKGHEYYFNTEIVHSESIGLKIPKWRNL